MNKLALYQEDVDFKTYILKVSKVFKKMETDLGAYRLKDNNPERCLKMLKKRAQVSELVFENLFKNVVDDGQNSEYANLFQQIDKFLRAHQNQVISFINGYFKSKAEYQTQPKQERRSNSQSHLETQKDINESETSINNIHFYKSQLLSMNINPLKLNKDKAETMSNKHNNTSQQMAEKQHQLLKESKITTTMRKRVGSGHKKFSEKVSLKFVPHDAQKVTQNNNKTFDGDKDKDKSFNLQNNQTNKANRQQNAQQINQAINPPHQTASKLIEQQEKIKKLETKVKVIDEQLKDMGNQYEKLYLDKQQIQRINENLKQMNEALMSHATKHNASMPLSSSTDIQIQGSHNRMQPQKHNRKGQLRNIQEIAREERKEQKEQIKQEEEDASAVQKIFGQNERMALEKVNYWGDVRKGLKEKMERINNIQSSNVHKQLKGLLRDLTTQQHKLTDNPNKGYESSDEDDMIIHTKQPEETKQIVRKYADKGTNPDSNIFDLPRIQRDMSIFQSLVDEYQREMDQKNQQLKKLTNQMESLLKILEDDQQTQAKNKKYIAQLTDQLDKSKRRETDLKEQLNYVKIQFGIDAEKLKKELKQAQRHPQHNTHSNSNYPGYSNVAPILQKKYDDVSKITDISKLQEMCVSLQNENYDLRLRVHELETLLKKHNIEPPRGNSTLYSKDALKQMTAQNQKETKKDKQDKQRSQQQQGDHTPLDSYNAEDNMLQGKKLFEVQKQAQEKMSKAKKDFHKLSSQEQGKFMSSLNPDQQKQFLGSLTQEQKKVFIEQQMKNGGGKVFMDQMMENFDDLDPKTQKQFLNNMSSEEKKKFFDEKEKFEEKKLEEEKKYDNFDNMDQQEKDKFLQNMSVEQKEQFFQKKQQHEEMKVQQQYTENMIKNFDKLSENEKKKFLANMTEDERTQFFLKKKEWDAKQQRAKRRMGNFANLNPEEQKKLIASLSPEQQQQLIQENKQQFYNNAAQNFEKMSAEDQIQFMANLTPQQQKEFIKEKQFVQEQIKKEEQKAEEKQEEEKKEQMKENLQNYMKQQVMVNQKSFQDKKLQTGDDNIESFENHSVNDFILQSKLKEVGNIMNKQENNNNEQKEEPTKKVRRMKVIGPNGEVEYVTENSDDEQINAAKEQIKKKKKISQKEQEKVEKVKKRKKVINKEGKEEEITDSEEEKPSKEIRKKLQEQLEKKIRDRGNKGGYLEGGEDINPAEMEYLYDIMKQEYKHKGEQLFKNKGDHVMNMFKHLFNPKDIPTHEQFTQFMLRIQKMHNKCGGDCKHLKRFFTRLGFIRKGWWTNRIILKMSQPLVEPMKFPKLPNPNIYGKQGINKN